MSLLRFSIPLLLASLFINVLLNPLRSGLSILLFGPTMNVKDNANDNIRNILLLTAHPDDECMFFAPTVLALTTQYQLLDSQNSNHDKEKAKTLANLYSLCLSVGDAEGLGDVRREELDRSLDVLGVDKERRWVVDHPELQDNMTVFWDVSTIASVIEPYVLKHNIGTILTFDRRGISSHPNHRSLPDGVLHYLSSNSKQGPPHHPRPRLFTLVTVPLIHKYIGPLAALLAKLDVQLAASLDSLTRANVVRLPVFVSGMDEYVRAMRAMWEHRTQMVWFRWLYIVFSRYMWVNEWVEVIPSTTNSEHLS